MGSYAQYIGFYDESYIQFHIRRIEANNQKEAEEKFIKHLERVNCIADPNKIYVDLISDIDIIGFPKTALNPYPYDWLLRIPCFKV